MTKPVERHVVNDSQLMAAYQRVMARIFIKMSEDLSRAFDQYEHDAAMNPAFFDELRADTKNG